MASTPSGRWDPLRELIALHEHLGQLVGTDAPGWTPPADLYETPSHYVLSVELPGLARTDIEIRAEENRIAVRGARTSPANREVCSEHYHRVERGHGRFSRAFSLPDAIDVEKVIADLKDGVLTITMPKAGDRSARKIDVS